MMTSRPPIKAVYLGTDDASVRDRKLIEKAAKRLGVSESKFLRAAARLAASNLSSLVPHLDLRIPGYRDTDRQEAEQ